MSGDQTTQDRRRSALRQLRLLDTSILFAPDDLVPSCIDALVESYGVFTIQCAADLADLAQNLAETRDGVRVKVSEAQPRSTWKLVL